MPIGGGSSGGVSIESTVTTGTTGSILFVGAASALTQDNTNLFFDDTNNRLCVGNAAALVASQVALAAGDWFVVGNTTGGTAARQTIRYTGSGRALPVSVGSSSDGDKLVFFNQSGNIKVAIGMDDQAGMWFQTIGNAVSTFRWYIGTTGVGTQAMTLLQPGYLGVGITTPTALVHVGASTTARASMCIPSGTAPTSPVSGDLWYDGTNLRFRDGATTRVITWT